MKYRRPGPQRPPPPWLYLRPATEPDDGLDEAARDAADDALLERLQRSAFDFFWQHTDDENGLVADASYDGSPCSIASVGFALSAYPVGVERGWVERAKAVRRALLALRFFARSDQSGRADATGHRGFYFHFLDMKTGARVWNCELSMIDTTVLIAGCLTAAAYFTARTPDETELRQLAEELYEKVDWRWAQSGKPSISLGWKPGHGFLNYGWQGYSEGLIMHVLGLASPTHPLDGRSFYAWTLTYQWENLYGYDVLYAGPLFIHQLSHGWLDLRGLRDDFMREKRCDYFENSRRITYVHREYAIRNPLGFQGYGDQLWGLSAGEGPNEEPIDIDGRRQKFLGYAARGAPYGPDDGTLAGPAVLGSLVFAPEIVLPIVRRLSAPAPAAGGDRLLVSGFNPTVGPDGADGGWVAPHQIGFDQGLIVLMIENYRSGLPWRLTRQCSAIRRGLTCAGFKGGWLQRKEPAPPDSR